MSDLGGKAVQGLRKGFDFLRTKTKETIDLGKLSQQVSKLEARRLECYQELGQRVVVMFDMDRFEPDSLKERVNEVHDITRQLETLQAQLQSLRHHESGHHDSEPPDAPSPSEPAAPDAQP